MLLKSSRRRFSVVLAWAALAFLQPAVASPTRAQEPPSPAQVLGYGLGDRFTDVAGVDRYFRVLSDSSARVSVSEYGRTPEGRPLIQVLVASPEIRSRLDSVLDLNRELTDPETTTARAREIAARNPGVVYFSYGVHGNEAASSEAAMWTAWDLARGAPELRGVLDSIVVVLDPVANPDGRDRYVTWYRQARGARPNPDPVAREHREPWPGGRYNHYLFDLNRDWSWATQPETRARLATWDHWSPEVHVDFHEMGPESTYFFFPPTAPINPIYTNHVLSWGRRFGRANAAAFDHRGWRYFTEESYDLFYPGYGDSWPSLLGAVGMTYEQAGGGSAGLSVRRSDGTTLTLRQRAEHHRVAGNTTLRTAARGRTALLLGFAKIHRRVDEGLSDVLLVPSGDGGEASALVGLLRTEGIRVERAERAFRADADPYPGYERRRAFPAGTYRVLARQPRGRLAAALLRPDNPLHGQYSYDITAWSLPYAYGVAAYSVRGRSDALWTPVADSTNGTDASARVASSSAASAGASGSAVGFVVRSGFAPDPALVSFLARGGRAFVLGDTFTLGEVSYARGAVLLPRDRNPELDSLMTASGLDRWAVPVATSRTDGGSDLGTSEARLLRLPRVALLGGAGTRPTSFGAHWYFLERVLGLPMDVLKTEDVADVDLDAFDVVVVPGGAGVARALGDDGREALRSWIQRGGVLVGVDDGARSLAGPLANVESREPGGLEEGSDTVAAALATRRDRERRDWRETMQGAVLPLELDPRSPLAFGAGAGSRSDRTFVLSSGNAFQPSSAFESAGWFAADVRQVSGVASGDVLDRLGRGSWLVDEDVGKGSVILFADDPLFRLFWHGSYALYTNALFMGGGRGRAEGRY